MKRFKAFTLVELLVTMIISGIVLSMASLCYEIIYKQYHRFSNINGHIHTALEVKAILNNDWLQAAFITKGDEKSILLTYRERHPIVYAFGESYIVRKTEALQDTFFISSVNFKTAFLGEEVKTSGGLADEVYFESEVLEEKESFYFHKHYGADVFMELDKPE